MQTMKANKKLESNGFTLVELLVVVAIIATLAALSLTMGPRMMGAARASESMQNLRQIGPLLATYATEHDMKLPAAKGPVALNDGTTADLQWHETCLRLLFPETPPAEFKTAAWWKNHKTILRNPLFKENATPRGWSPLNPGYALNEMIPENLALASTGVIPAHAELLMIRVPLAALGDPGRTPLIAHRALRQLLFPIRRRPARRVQKRHAQGSPERGESPGPVRGRPCGGDQPQRISG